MRSVWRTNKTSEMGLSSWTWLPAFALAVLLGLCVAAPAASDNAEKGNQEAVLKEVRIFDPFMLRTVTYLTRGALRTDRGTNASSNLTNQTGDPMFPSLILFSPLGRPPIRIPFRPSIRSPFRPPLVSR